MALFWLSFCWYVDIGFCSVTFAGMHWVCRLIYHCKIQVKFDINNHLQNFGYGPFSTYFLLVCVDIDFRSITFAGMHWFYWKFAEGYIIVKYRSSLILVIILAKLKPFLDLVFVVGIKYKVKILFPFNNFWRDALILFEVWSEGLPLGIGAIIRTSVFFLFHIKWLAL